MSRILKTSYQYLQQSKIPTDKFQRSLPRLKIPNLEKTCSRYISALEPVFANDQRLPKTKEVTRSFLNGPAKDLNASLKAYDKTVKHSSYINQFWFDMYLSSRVPLPLNFNPFLAWRDAATDDLNDQLVRSTNFLLSAIRFKRSLEENLLEPEVFHLNPKKVSTSYQSIIPLVPSSIATYVSFMFKAFPLDMSQYKNLFNSTRIPKQDKDEIVKSDPKKNRHVLVLRNGQFYTFDLIDHDGNLLAPEYVYANLHHIANLSHDTKDLLSISELTSDDRNVWAKERDHLISLSSRNRQNLEKLDSALFALCLDDKTFQQEQEIDGAHNFLHGACSTKPLNRWFDKSFSIIVTKDGHSAINFEHSWGDGVAILRFFNDTYNDTTNNPQIKSPLKDFDPTLVSVSKLDFDIDARLKESISASRAKHISATSNLELGSVKYASFNKEYFKKNKLSADAMSQLSFQLAFKKVYGHTPVTYESCSTAAFKGGRTETVRPCTVETNKAVESILKNRSSSNVSLAELRSLLQDASKKHFQLCKEASMGDGFDRHLFGLKEIAARSGKVPEFYSDPLYHESQHYTLSTSTLYGECFAGGGFAPVVPDGFGLGYGYVDAMFGVLVSSYRDKRNNTQFVQALDESLTDIKKIVEN